MPFTARVFGLLESELRRHVTFSFTVDETGHLATRSLRPGDRVSLRVWARNNSAIAMKNIRGAIRPTPFAQFDATPYGLPSLAPNEEREIARIEAVILETPREGFVLDHLATLNVAGQADLSEFWFRDVGRPLAFAHAPIAVSDETTVAASGGRAPARRPSERPKPWTATAGTFRTEH
jgi:hypothetical protein